MIARGSREAAILASTFVVGLLVCLLAGVTPETDPLFAAEVVAGALAVAWAVTAVGNLLRGHRLGRQLDAVSTPHRIDGVPVQVVPSAGRVALVIGAVRPTVYVGEELLHSLTADERRAVLLHEEHHRATWAPVRAAALESWIALVGRYARLRRVLLERLADLESMADSYALARGCSRAAVAAALLKTDASGVGLSAVSYGAERRIAALLDKRTAIAVRHHLPYEWLPAAAMMAIALACHTLGGSLP